ncbi:MAG: TauD/TfdA family dioxygenase [Alphaproteobacteria bacterium]|nr:TauD/TfdA family dioxygenase [Alphaproteobacteria bacterium]
MIDAVETALRQLAKKGYCQMGGPSDKQALALQDRLGHVIHIEQVRSDATGPALVSSQHSLSPHTDHHAAHFVLWRCLEQAEWGGDSLVVDGLALVAALPAHHREALRGIRLVEHNIFEGDVDEHPMLTTSPDGGERLYYSYWLADETLAGAARAAFDMFSNALEVVPVHRVRLRPGDLLVVNNHRMLHGRTRIGGNRTRHLVRYWLAPQPHAKVSPR